VKIGRQLGGLLALSLVLAPSVVRAQTVKVGSASRGIENEATSSVEVTLGALPQITAQEAAMYPGVPPLGTGVSEAEYAARKQAASAQSLSMTGGSLASAAPRIIGGGGLETPPAAGFQGLKFGCAGTSLAPPDQGLAVNQSYVLEMVNACVAVYDKAGNLQPGFPKSLDAFFGLNPSAFTFDVRALYDWANNRFIAVASRQGASIPPQILVAVSQTSNPLGGWNVYKFQGPAGTLVGETADFPHIGQDRSALYVSFNRFTSGDAFVDARIMILNKALMYAGLGVTYKYWFNLNFGGPPVDTVQPANEFSPSDHPRAEFLVNSFNINFGGGQCSSSACNGLAVWAISNPLAIGASSSELSGIAIATGHNYSLPPLASQPSCSNCIDTGDVRISGLVQYHAGSLFASLNTASTSAAGSHFLWFEVKPVLNDNGTTCASGSNLCPDITSAQIVNEDCFECGIAGDWYYATLQPDLENNATMVFNFSNGSNAPSVAYTSRRVTEAPNLMHDGGIYLINPVANYTLGTPPRRWGDYSATAPDLTSAASQVWFAGEFSNAAGIWKTAIGHNSFNQIKYP
jgi:hypothetical protein